MKSNISLSNSEWEVMECLWSENPLSIMQMVKLLEDRIGWSKSTTNTMVRRMTEKDYIRFEEGDKSRLYYPVINREDVLLQETESLLHKAFNGNIGLLVNMLVSNKKLSQKDIAELKDILHKEDK